MACESDWALTLITLDFNYFDSIKSTNFLFQIFATSSSSKVTPFQEAHFIIFKTLKKILIINKIILRNFSADWDGEF